MLYYQQIQLFKIITLYITYMMLSNNLYIKQSFVYTIKLVTKNPKMITQAQIA